jgi:hypothetical protein
MFQGAPSAVGEALDVGPGLRPRNGADMLTFLNLTAFLDALLPAAGPALFEPWVYAFTTEAVALTGRHPLLSGLYRLLRVVMDLADRTGVFAEDVADPQVSTQHASHESQYFATI